MIDEEGDLSMLLKRIPRFPENPLFLSVIGGGCTFENERVRALEAMGKLDMLRIEWQIDNFLLLLPSKVSCIQ